MKPSITNTLPPAEFYEALSRCGCVRIEHVGEPKLGRPVEPRMHTCNQPPIMQHDLPFEPDPQHSGIVGSARPESRLSIAIVLGLAIKGAMDLLGVGR